MQLLKVNKNLTLTPNVWSIINMKNTMKKESGFTLIELLVVIAIIGILAAIAIPQFSDYKKKAFNGRAQTDLRNGITSEEAFFVDEEEYATCNSADCVSTLPGFVLSQGVEVDFAAADDAGTNDAFSGASCHAQGDREYAWASAGAEGNTMSNEALGGDCNPQAPGIGAGGDPVPDPV
jgi:type IV pilus assembly protein PilA